MNSGEPMVRPPELYESKRSGLGFYGSYPRYLTNVGGILYFTADDGQSGQELWKSDGTEPGTVRVKDIWSGTYPMSISESPLSLTNVDALFFSAPMMARAEESSGTSDGTRPVPSALRISDPVFLAHHRAI